MDFYNSTESKQYARNRTNILKEINDIEENIIQAVDEHKFSCDVYNTKMTDSRDFVLPSIEAKAHCVMELSSVSIHQDYEYEDIDDLDNFIKEIYCNHANMEDDFDIIECGNANNIDNPYNIYANGGNANGELLKKNYFRIGEILKVKDRNDINPLEFKVSEINENGDIIDLEIINRGEFDNNLFSSAQLEYKNMDNWLDIDSNYGLISDLRITRDNAIQVKDLDDTLLEDIYTKWYNINKIYDANTLPLDSFGMIPDAYIKNQNEIYIKTSNGWILSNKLYDYVSFKMPFNHGLEGTVCYNVFGNTWVKTHCGWYISKHIYDLGDSERPDAFAYQQYDIVYYNEVIKNEDGDIINRIQHKIYKCCHNVWKDIIFEYDWSEVPDETFGDNLDMFIYPSGNYRVKLNDVWVSCPNEWRFDSMYLEDTFGEEHDIIKYSGTFEPYKTYVKMAASKDYPNGHWKLVEKIWDLNEYLLGRLPVDVDLTWTIKNIIMDDFGDGYMYPTSVIFSNGNATAYVNIVNDKIINTELLYGGDNYIEIPNILFVMEVNNVSKKYFKVWKRIEEDFVIQDEMEQVIKYFESTKKYTISRVTNDSTGNTFYWHLQWN